MTPRTQSLLTAIAGLAVALPSSAEPPLPVEFAWIAQGEACTDHSWSAPVTGNPDYAVCFGGGMLVCAKSEDPPEGGYRARSEAVVDTPGTYELWLACTPPGTGSPLSVSIDGAATVPVGTARVEAWGPGTCFSWMPCARVGLAVGAHTIDVLVTGRRKADNQYYAYLDAVALSRVGTDPTVPFAGDPPPVDVGETAIRFYSGNGSVGHFMSYWGTGNAADTGAVDDDLIALLRRCSCTAYCDYLAWCRIEEQSGVWDFSFYRANAEKLRQAGIDYNIFAWLHYPPKWFTSTEDFVPYKELSSGAELVQQSLFAPSTLRVYEEFYRRLAEELGDEVAFARLGMPSEYGEIGYPVGMTRWLVPDDQAKLGYWCGDRFALESFRGAAQARFRSLDALNEAWGTTFASFGEVTPPDTQGNAAAQKALATKSPQDLRRWLDFVDWYQDAWSNFAEAATEIVGRHLPGKEVILSLGYGGETVAFGNDESRHIKRMSRIGASAQTPGDIGYFATRRVSSACRAYHVPYYTEPPGSVDRHREVRRIFMDVSNGTQTWFDYPQNMDGARDLLHEYKTILTGDPPVCDVAFMLPSSWWWCHPDWGWPVQTAALAEALRDRMDFEVVDELLVTDGALDTLGIRLLILAEGDFMRADTLEALESWVRAGGVLVVLQGVDLADLDGDRTVAQRLLPDIAAGGPPADLAAAWRQAGRAVDKGHVLWLSGAPTEPATQDAIVDLTYRLSSIDPARGNAVLVDDQADGILTTLFVSRVILYNGGPKMVEKTLRFRRADFGDGAPAPSSWEMNLAVAPHSIATVPLAANP